MPDEPVRRMQRRLGRALTAWWVSGEVAKHGMDRDRLGASLLPYLEAEGLQLVESGAPGSVSDSFRGE